MPYTDVLYTVGHSNRTLQELVALLHEAQVQQLVDVRSYPSSRRHPHFARAALEQALPVHGVAYRWMPELGGMRKAVPDSVHSALGEASAYADYMLTDAFVAAAQDLIRHAAGPTALMCAEARPDQCHRRFLCDWLVTHGLEVCHVVAPDQRERHVPSTTARVEDGKLFYDRGQLSLL